ncbi:MAG: DUF3365 domain-containing protein [Planctomycetota bacterium]|nr:DUF3365 domain-containing protein [Planctomycetota bacterium]
MTQIRSSRSILLSGAMAGLAVLSQGCTDSHIRSQPSATSSVAAKASAANELDLWQCIVSQRLHLRRTVKYTPTGIETVTESEDAAVARQLIALGTQLQSRLAAGDPLRPWDPAFIDRYAQAVAIHGEVRLTSGGFATVESSSDVGAMAILLEHAMSVSDVVRQGPRSSGRTPMHITVGETLPAPEVAIGGVPHRFLLAQPDAGQVGRLKEQGVDLLVNYRHAREHAEYDEKSAAAETGIEYCNVPYMGVGELTDQVIDSARATLAQADRKGQTAALHCRTGNRVGPGWAAYRVLDCKVPLRQAIDEAKAMQMLDPMMESATRDYIRRHNGSGSEHAAWKPSQLTEINAAQKAQYQTAVEAKDLMFSQLIAALSKAMNSEPGSAGTAAAIGVCKEQAPRIAQAVATERGVMIGRTGTRLRSPANTLPKWASTAAITPPQEPQVYANPDGSLGVTLPIRLAATCLACHGDASRIDREVAEAIAAKYPKDQATGYREGELRGWFWIEVPARDR